jgi:hypothetical protein
MKTNRLIFAKIFGLFSLCLGLVAGIAVLIAFVFALCFGRQDAAGYGAAVLLISLAVLVIGSPFGLLAAFCGCRRLGMAATALCILPYPLAVFTMRIFVGGR